MPYIDGFLLPVPKKHLESYRKLATMASKVYLEHGALEYREFVGEDLAVKGVKPFTAAVKVKPGETVVMAWILYRSRAHRDRVNAKVMKDPRMQMEPKMVPFDSRRMHYGGFELLVKA